MTSVTPRSAIRASALLVDSDDVGPPSVTPRGAAAVPGGVSEGAVERMADACRVLLEGLGEDVSREGLRKTPMRMAKALLALTAGYSLDPAAIVSDALFSSDSAEMVVVRDIDFSSMCEHHMLPFFGTVSIGYLPQGRVIGLSKLARACRRGWGRGRGGRGGGGVWLCFLEPSRGGACERCL